MNKDKKCIKSNGAMKVATIKNRMRNATNPFDGNGHWFNQALLELRKEGVSIIHNKQNCHYYNPLTINKSWGYSS
jgi:hypothetical protein